MNSLLDKRRRKSPKTGTRHLSEVQRKDNLLSSIHRISSWLIRPISLDKILTSIVEEASRAFGFTRVALYLVSEDRRLLECKYMIGWAPSIEQRAFTQPFCLDRHECIETAVIKSGKTAYIRDCQTGEGLTDLDRRISRLVDRVSTLTVPLKLKKDVIGLIGADKSDVRLDMTKAEIKAYSTFANQASIVIENARLQEQNKKKIRQLLSLQEISKNLISSNLNLKNLLDVISVNALRITVASTCALLLIDKERNTLNIVSQVGYENADTARFQLSLGQGISGWVAETGIPLLIKDVSTEPRYVELIAGVQSELAVPLIRDGEVLGVLNVDSFRKSAFSNDDMEMLMIFARLAAALIDKVRLYDEITTERNLAENILESSPNGIVTTDHEVRIRSINRKAQEIFGLRAEAAIGRKVADVFEEVVAGVFDLAHSEGIVVDNLEVKPGRKGPGSPTTLGMSTSILKSLERKVCGVIGTIQDLTETKKTEELMRRMDRLSSLGQLSAGIAHEIRNPLTSINFNVQMLSKKVSDDAVLIGLIDDTIQGIDKIKLFVKTILDFAKPRAPSLKPGRLLDVVADSVALMKSQISKENVTIRIAPHGDVPEIVFDPQQIQQVFINLILNAIEAMPNGGTVEVTTEIAKGAGDGKCHLAVSVEDTGCGIPQEIQPRIFDPFFTTKAEGTGLGLSIVHKIMEQHDATIDCISKVPGGTIFVLRFPMNGGQSVHG